MRVHGKYFLKNIRKKYDIDSITSPDGYLYCKIKRGMYGLKQAARLARDQLIENLKPFGYSPSVEAPNIWVHTTRRTKCCLCMDEFGVKYFLEEDAQHLIQVLQHSYSITINKTGSNFCGLQLDWNYQEHWVDISMPQYIGIFLAKLEHAAPSRQKHAPHRWVPNIYGSKVHMTQNEDTSDILSDEEATHMQRIVESFLYYA